jgi:hypothetical protein
MTASKTDSMASMKKKKGVKKSTDTKSGDSGTKKDSTSK